MISVVVNIEGQDYTLRLALVEAKELRLLLGRKIEALEAEAQAKTWPS